MNIKKLFSIVFIVIVLLSFSACHNDSEVNPVTNTETPENTYTIDEIIDKVYKNSLDPLEEQVFTEEDDLYFGGKTDPKYLRRASDLFVGTQINIAPFNSNTTEVVFAYYPMTDGGKVIIILCRNSVSNSKTVMLVCNINLNGTEFVAGLRSGISNLTVEKVDIIDVLDFLATWNCVCGSRDELTNYGKSANSSKLYPITNDSPFFGVIHSNDGSIYANGYLFLILDDTASFQDVYDRFGVQIYS